MSEIDPSGSVGVVYESAQIPPGNTARRITPMRVGQETSVELGLDMTPDDVPVESRLAEMEEGRGLTLRRATQSLYVRYGKFWLDMIVALGLLVIVLPLAPIVAIAIKLDSPGPVLFRQRRVTKDCKEFWAIKFRTMLVVRRDPSFEEDVAFDPTEVTRVGRFLRRHHLDEMMQVLHVLTRQLSIVGPRPIAARTAEELYWRIPEYELRSLVRAGLTGPAQAIGESAKTTLEHEIVLREELAYIEHCSLWLDLKILYLTVIEIFKGRGR